MERFNGGEKVSRPRRIKKEDEELPNPTPIITEDILLPSEPKPITPLQALVAEAPNLPPLPPDVVGYIEFTFRPKYEEFLGKLKKLANE